MSTHIWSQLIQDSTEAITYTLRSIETHYPSASTNPCQLVLADFVSNGETILLAIRCRHCSGIPNVIRYYEYYEMYLAVMLYFHFPYMVPSCAERVTEEVLRVVERVNAAHRCPHLHPEVNLTFTTVVEISVQPLLAQPPTLEERALREEEIEDIVKDQYCVICMEEIETPKSALRMPCSHVFHEACLVQWLSNSHVCPLCRYEMPYNPLG